MSFVFVKLEHSTMFYHEEGGNLYTARKAVRRLIRVFLKKERVGANGKGNGEERGWYGGDGEGRDNTAEWVGPLHYQWISFTSNLTKFKPSKNL